MGQEPESDSRSGSALRINAGSGSALRFMRIQNTAESATLVKDGLGTPNYTAVTLLGHVFISLRVLPHISDK